MKKLCIFDFDGTLADSAENITYFVNLTMNRFALPEIDTKTVVSFVGNGAKNLIERCLEYNKSKLPTDEVLEYYLVEYNKKPSYLIKIYDKMMDTLQKLKSNGVSLAILSNKPDSSTKLIADEIFPKDLFFTVLGKSEKFETKPSPMSANYIAEGFEKENCYFIGDSDSDILTGKNANMKTIGVSWGLRERVSLVNAGADFVADTPEEIITIVLGK